MENYPAKSGLAVTSLILGVLSLFFLLMGLSLPIAALGIIVALLSRGNGDLLPRAKAGLALSLLGAALGICVIIWAYHMLNSAEFGELIKQLEEMYGLSGGGVA